MTDEIVITMRAFAATKGLTVMPTYDAFKLYPAWNLKLISSDCAHPNQSGYRLKETSYFSTLMATAKAMLGR